MKRLLGILVALVMLFGAALAEGDTKEFEVTMTNTIFPFSASKWSESKESRALLTIMLALELQDEDNSFVFADVVTSGESYVLSDGETNVMVSYYVDGENWVVVYTPDSGTAVYSKITAVSEFVVELTLQEMENPYYRNSQLTILAVAKALGEALGVAVE